MLMIIKGFLLGLIMVLPGMSGGTVLLVFGLYEKLVKDLLAFRIKPYWPLFLGLITGLFTGGFTFALFFTNLRDVTVAFLLGCLLASIRAVIRECPELNMSCIVMAGIGGLIGWLLGGEPLGVAINVSSVNWWLLLIGGAFASVAMIIPGVPGSSVLIVLGIYDTILFSIKELDIVNLAVFGAGSLLGIFLLLNLLDKLYTRYKGLLSYFFAGLIIGSARGILPSTLDLGNGFLFVVGFCLVWIWSSKGQNTVKIKEELLTECKAHD